MEYKNLTIENFLEKLGSSDSMPGGGVASSLVAANGISLTLMVCNLTLGKEKYKEFEELVTKVKSKAKELNKMFLELMDKDAETFKIMENVFAMPNATEEEKKMRKEKMQEACKLCCLVPKEVIEKALQAIEITNSIYGKSNKSAESDLRVANILLRSAVEGAWQNILINLKYIDDDKFIEEYNDFGSNVMKIIYK